MILTGKAKEDFFNFHYKRIKWKHEDVEHFKQESETIQYAIIIEWFDSVGIPITISCVLPIKIYGYGFSIDIEHDYNIFLTREQATEQAIIKAKDIYNERT